MTRLPSRVRRGWGGGGGGGGGSCCWRFGEFRVGFRVYGVWRVGFTHALHSKLSNGMHVEGHPKGRDKTNHSRPPHKEVESGDSSYLADMYIPYSSQLPK